MRLTDTNKCDFTPVLIVCEMSSKMKSKTKCQNAGRNESQRELLYQREYDTLAENLSTLKRRIGKQREENEFLQNELMLTQQENSEYISHLRQRAVVREKYMSDESHKEIQEHRKLRQNLQDKHKEQSNEIQMKILQMEHQLAKLNLEIADLKEVKILQLHHSRRIAELERDLTVIHQHHSECMDGIRAGFIKKKKSFEEQEKNWVQAFTIFANKKASSDMMSFMNKVFQENKCLSEELKNLLLRDQAVQRQHATLQTIQQELLQEQEYLKKRLTLHIPPCTSLSKLMRK